MTATKNKKMKKDFLPFKPYYQNNVNNNKMSKSKSNSLPSLYLTSTAAVC